MTLFDNGKATACRAGLFCKGFTLIELLVVVLIIGILAAIAWPKYRVAVRRARAVQAIVQLRAIVKAQEEYYMANGGVTKDLEKLSIEIKNTKDYSFVCKSTKDGDGINTCYAIGFAWFEMAMIKKNGFSDKMWCIGTGASQQELCRTFGPLEWGSADKTGYYKVTM